MIQDHLTDQISTRTGLAPDPSLMVSTMTYFSARTMTIVRMSEPTILASKDGASSSIAAMTANVLADGGKP